MTDTGSDNLLYLDHAATSWPKPPEVDEGVARALTSLMANAGRSGHQAAVSSARMVFETRERLAELFGIERSEDLVFVRGCTEGLNLVLKGFLKPGDRVAVSPMEHNSVMRPLMRLIGERGITVHTLPADPLGRIDLEASRNLANESPPELVVIQHASNVNGAVQDLAALRRAFPDSPMLVDAAQTAGVLPLDVAALGIDFLAASVHKGLLGPTGVGVCYISPRHDVLPLVEGGTGSDSESTAHPDFRPDRYEAGTLNLHGIAGTFGALDGLGERGLLGERKRLLTKMLVDGLDNIPGLTVHSPKDGTALCVSFTADHLRPEQVAVRLEREYGVLCRPGLHCAPNAHRHLGTFPDGTVRLSPGWGNTEKDIETALLGVETILAAC
jgi:cysteine desulfurase / selenocysteine lyase